MIIFAAISSTNDQEDTVNGWNTFIFFPQQTFLVVCVAITAITSLQSSQLIVEQSPNNGIRKHNGPAID